MWCTVNVKSIIITMIDRWDEDGTSCAIIHEDVKMCDANMIQMNFIPSIIRRYRLTSWYYSDWSTVFSSNTVYQRCCSRYSPSNSLVIYSINEIRMWIIGLAWVHVLHYKWWPFSTNRLGWLLQKYLSLSEIWVHSFDVGNHKIIETIRNNRTQRKLPFIQP